VLTFEIEANAYLKRMVRMLVGTLLRVGYGKITPEEFRTILQNADRNFAGPAAEAQGLCLKAVYYTEEEE
jgi:tRNA pseudouridine38-40 synthase